MSVTDQQLSSTCRALEQASQQFLRWMDACADRVGQEKVGLSKEFRRLTTQARRLDQAVQRPMCVGVFGPSQSGKSYLISALARKGTALLLADFAGQAVDFIRDLNPEVGGIDRSGHAFYRASVASAAQRAGADALAHQTDLIKIIGNTYYADCDHSEDVLLTQEQLNAALDSLAQAAQTAPVDPLNADDVYDLQAYFERYFKGFERVRLLRHGFWERAG
ncbi:MAG: virulence factor SrfC family protein [Candidatus Competibacteraceae bacterium]